MLPPHFMRKCIAAAAKTNLCYSCKCVALALNTAACPAQTSVSSFGNGGHHFNRLQGWCLRRKQPLRHVHHQLYTQRTERPAHDTSQSADGIVLAGQYGLSMSQGLAGGARCVSAADALGNISAWDAAAGGALPRIITAVRWVAQSRTLGIMVRR